MTRIFLIALLALGPAPALADGGDLPPGLISAQLLPGWEQADGSRIAALELVLQPGWKTYWRSPGDSGLPPDFDWSDSVNLADVDFHWPAPQAIDSGGAVSLGFEDRLILPFTAHAIDPDASLDLAAVVDLGLCERICVPARLELQAMPARTTPDPRITAAIAQMPRESGQQPICEVDTIHDGMRLTLHLAHASPDAAAIELDGQPDIWVSEVKIDQQGRDLLLMADLVASDGEPFTVPLQQLRLTLIAADGAVEMRGCDTARPRQPPI